MVLDSVLVVEGIKAIPGAIKVFKEAWSAFRKKAPKPEDIIPIEENLQEIFRRLDSIKEGAWIINAYFELYGHSLDLYTTSDDFIKAMAKAPLETKSLFASTIHLDLKKKFDRGIAQFLSAYGEEVDRNDVGVIELHINKLRDLISEGKGYVESENYKELEKVNINITITSNDLLGMSQARLRKIIKELQKIRGA
ncbi:MAG: hypothetical protein KAT65_23205 [Methanophagales archaeon]|nr:hypothetical protein [Methanophagales archaeon]